MLDLSLDLIFYQCRSITAHDDVVPLVEAMFEAGFVFEQLVDGRMRRINQREQIGALVKGHYLVDRVDRKTNTPVRWTTLFKAYPHAMPDLIGSFEFLQINPRDNRLRLSALIDFEFANQRGYVEPYTQGLKELIVTLYAVAQPELGWIDRMDRNTTDETGVRKQRLLALSWVNVFGPSYVAQYGEDFLLGLPGCCTERLPDGGVLHQLSERFAVADQKAARVIRSQVKDYCAAQGLKVTCHAPYVLPEAEPADRMDF